MVHQLYSEINYDIPFEANLVTPAYSKSFDFEAILETATDVQYSEDIAFSTLVELDENDIALLYSDLTKEERIKIVLLHKICTMSDNPIFNEVLFDKAKVLSQSRVALFYTQKSNHQYYYAQSSRKELFVLNEKMMNNTNITLENEKKLSYSESFEFLLQLQSSSLKASNVIDEGVLKESYKTIALEYESLLDDYMRKLRDKI